jgi:hypothetical protein
MLTRKSNAAAHPGFLDLPQPRRTSQQVEADRAHTMAATAIAREKEQANRHAALSSIAQFEESLERDEEELRLHSNRPDLHYTSKKNGAGKIINHEE